MDSRSVIDMNAIIPHEPGKDPRVQCSEIQLALTRKELSMFPNHRQKKNFERMIKYFEDGGLLPDVSDAKWLVDGEFVDYEPTSEDHRTKAVMSQFVCTPLPA